MAQFLAPIINSQQENANGEPLSGGTIEVYLAGTSTPATTYSDQAGLDPNTWPIVLNTLGVNNQGAVWLTGGSAYKFIIKDSLGIVQRTIDNVSGINDSAVTTDQWLVYQATPTFVSATSFTVAGDQTQIFQVGRRLKSTNTGGTIYSTITGSVYLAPNTTVTVRNDSGVLDSGLSQVSYGVMSVLDTSLPGGMINYGQCRLSKSGANLLLSPYNGNRITINGSVCLIPAAGVTLAPTALTPSTLYYIYAFMNGATLTLEASTTVPTTDSTTGVQIKTGDVTRTLVGMARPITGPAWQDTTNQRFVASWFNRKPVQLRAALGANQATTSTSYAELTASLRVEYLIWLSSQTVSLFFDGGVTLSTTTTVLSTTIAINTTLTESWSTIQVSQVNAFGNPSCSLVFEHATEGYHVASPFARTSTGDSCTYQGSGTAGTRCSIKGTVEI